MKFIHLSDLHIGKRVNEFSMINDQKYILEQILNIIANEEINAVIVSGDVYDKSIPAVEAVTVFDDFLTSLNEMGLIVFMISGNHDSDERLNFGSSLFEANDVHIAAKYQGKLFHHVIEDAYGAVHIYQLPFVKASQVKRAFPEAKIETYEDAVREVLAHAEINQKQRNILVAHQFVSGKGKDPTLGGSEGALTQHVGTVEKIGYDCFDAFRYVALGHIHSPQKVGRETVRYCGSPLKYSFSEAGQEKSITVVELKEKGTVELRTIPLEPLRDMRKIRGTYLEVTAKSFYENSNCEDYLLVTLTDEEDVPDGMAKLRTIYPNLMRLEYDNKRTRSCADIGISERVEEKSELELFRELYELQNNQDMTAQQEALVEELIRGLKA